MEILIIGGTKFVGRALTQNLLKRGHQITLFNRGKTNPDLFTEIEKIQGDRDGEISNLGDRTWDAVIDTCGYVPRIVKMSVEYLKDRVKQYLFISSISVYTSSREINRNEDAELVTLEDETIEEITGDSYGGLKVLCENVVRDTFGSRSIIVRPGLIVGPFDPTNRFTYWLIRIRTGGEILMPPLHRFTQQINVRDLANFCVTLIENETNGIFNATGNAITLQELFDFIKTNFSPDANFRPVDDQFLLDQKVGPWMEMPLWIPGEEGQGLMQVNIQRGIKEGLKLTPLKETIKDTLDWYDDVDGKNQEWPAGIKSEREEELLEILGIRQNNE